MLFKPDIRSFLTADLNKKNDWTKQVYTIEKMPW
jgi:hypothetical protein